MPAMDVDTALSTIGYGFGQVIIFMVSFFIYMYSVTESMTAGYLVVLTSCEFDTSHKEKTLLANSLLAGMVASGLFIGFLADRYGRKFVIRLALVGALSFSVISAFMPDLYSLSVLRMIVGTFLSAVASLQVGFLGEFHAIKWRPITVAICSQSQGLALIYCPLVGMAILPNNFNVDISSSYNLRVWRFLMMFFMIPGWLALVGICLVPETPHFLMSVNKPDQALLALKWICRMNRKKWEDVDITLSAETSSSTDQGGFWKTVWYEYKLLFSKPHVFKFFICLFLIFGIFFTSIGLGIWFPVIRNMDNSGSNRLCDLVNNNPTFTNREGDDTNSTDSESSKCNDEMTNLIDPVYYGLTYIACFILASVLVHCMTRKYVIALHILISMVLGISLNIMKQSTVVLIFFVLMMVLPGVLIPLATSVLVDCLPVNLRGKALCMVRSLARFGGVLGSTMIGLFIRVTCDVTFNIFNLCLAICVVLAVFQPKDIVT
ncbi:synaptic vesicle 2-related protein [Drosophila mauritiana]|uniref:Synaptic vesicle 2-related protein n=1 Tax=Drosophila mauritiana TaxID=7226 RepID=A0A6P8K0K9_DROMA|nr:synaptic vesicle 2-related protein [Drosophila mauritiana]